MTDRKGPYPLTMHMAKAMGDDFMHADQGGKMKSERFIAGVKKYQAHPYKRNIERNNVVWRENGSRIFHLPATQTGDEQARASVLLIPSLINKSDILDLMPEQSFFAWLAAQGVDAYLLDWGRITVQTDLQTVDQIAAHLHAAINAAKQHAASCSDASFTCLGYCMGGTLLAGILAGAQGGALCDKAVFLAAPWDFAPENHALSTEITRGKAAAYQLMSERKMLSADWIQNCFFAVSQDKAVEKFIAFADMDPDSDEARRFVAVEDWLNDGLDLPEPIARMCIDDWYGRNKPFQGQWGVNDTPVRAENIKVSSFVVASSVDRLVPFHAAQGLHVQIADSEIIDTATGHVGMMAGRKSVSRVWQPIFDWICQK